MTSLSAATTADRRRRAHSDHGAATTVVVLILPAVLLTVMVIVQFALAYHARQVVTQAAQEAAFAGTATDAQPDTPDRVANDVIADAGTGLVHDVDVQVHTTPEAVRVTVDATVADVVPGLSLHVSGSAQSPTESFRPQGAP